MLHLAHTPVRQKGVDADSACIGCDSQWFREWHDTPDACKVLPGHVMCYP